MRFPGGGGGGGVTWQPSPRGWRGTVFPGVGQDKAGGVVPWFDLVRFGHFKCTQFGLWIALPSFLLHLPFQLCLLFLLLVRPIKPLS